MTAESEQDTAGPRSNRWDLVRYYLKPIQGLFEDESITEIMVNRFDEVYVERRGLKERVDCVFADEATLETAVTQIATALKQDCHPQNQPRLGPAGRLNIAGGRFLRSQCQLGHVARGVD